MVVVACASLAIIVVGVVARCEMVSSLCIIITCSQHSGRLRHTDAHTYCSTFNHQPIHQCGAIMCARIRHRCVYLEIMRCVRTLFISKWEYPSVIAIATYGFMLFTNHVSLIYIIRRVNRNINRMLMCRRTHRVRDVSHAMVCVLTRHMWALNRVHHDIDTRGIVLTFVHICDTTSACDW